MWTWLLEHPTALTLISVGGVLGIVGVYALIAVGVYAASVAIADDSKPTPGLDSQMPWNSPQREQYRDAVLHYERRDRHRSNRAAAWLPLLIWALGLRWVVAAGCAVVLGIVHGATQIGTRIGRRLRQRQNPLPQATASQKRQP